MPPFAAVATTALLAVLAMVLTNDFYLRILFMCGVYYLCAAGMNVLAGYAGQKSLGQAGLFAAGAYAAALLTTRWVGIRPGRCWPRRWRPRWWGC
ncbi:branched-chain amino acid transport system / permease component family protein [Bordetella holmesii 44057]|nr:branched-chain amino acid transport system / permease component family protein [Bordetella holmesii 44057]